MSPGKKRQPRSSQARKKLDLSVRSPASAKGNMDITERGIVHRQEIEKKIVEANIRNQTLRICLASAIAVLAIVGVVLLLAFDKNVYGIVVITSSLVALARLFVSK
jgi:uncharacterized membrane protein